VATATDTLDDASAVCDDGQRRPTWRDLLSAILLVQKLVSHGQKSVERARRPGRLTDMAAGGSVAKLATVSVSGQPRSLAAAARASLVVSASATQVRTTNQRPIPPGSRTTRRRPPGMAGPSAVDRTIRGIGGRKRLCCRLTAATTAVASEARGLAIRSVSGGT
jgi:hypothetical protein